MVLIREKATRGQEIVTISRGTRPGAWARMNKVYYKNAFPITAVVSEMVAETSEASKDQYSESATS